MPPDFVQKTIETLSRRAGLRCSNPDCDKLTTGPNSDPDKVLNIGEAAHIYGAKAGAARYRPEMSDGERATISNAIWLCRDCHGLIDKDERRYPASLLLIWRDSHEDRVLKELGKPGDLLRLQIQNEELVQFADLPPFARQLIRDKPDYWEFSLAAELLDNFVGPTIRRATDLRDKLYSRKTTIIPGVAFSDWTTAKTAELLAACTSLSNILDRITISFGDVGVPGDPVQIVHACKLYGQCAERFIEIAEEAAFVKVPSGFEGVSECIVTGALHPVFRFPEVSGFIREMMSTSNLSGVHHYTLVINLPEGWSDAYNEAMRKGTAALKARDYEW